jgi:hypothetical protein
MNEWLTRGAAWLALVLYVGGELARAFRCGERGRVLGRWMASLGCAVFGAHVACAFQFYHQWSHAAAYADTARQTAELTGWKWGGGLYLNYLFALPWAGEVVWSWAHWAGYEVRPKWIMWPVRSFFWFMMFNGTVIFVHGPARWFGLALCATLLICWWRRPAPEGASSKRLL